MAQVSVPVYRPYDAALVPVPRRSLGFWLNVWVFIWGGLIGLIFVMRGHGAWASIWRAWAVEAVILAVLALIGVL